MYVCYSVCILSLVVGTAVQISSSMCEHIPLFSFNDDSIYYYETKLTHPLGIEMFYNEYYFNKSSSQMAMITIII